MKIQDCECGNNIEHIYYYPPQGYFVKCDYCGLKSESAEYEEKAVRKWNDERRCKNDIRRQVT